jgi:hypothetical protein
LARGLQREFADTASFRDADPEVESMTSLPRITVVFGVLALFGCNRSSDRDAAEPRGTIAATDRDDDRADLDDRDTDLVPASRAASATQAIAESRCAREQRCENVGADRKYSSMNDCRTRVQNDWKEDLNARECPGGVDQTELSECLSEIRNEDCNSPFDTLGRLAACTVAEICEETN